MASKASLLALFLAVNLLFANATAKSHSHPPPPPPPPPAPKPPIHRSPPPPAPKPPIHQSPPPPQPELEKLSTTPCPPPPGSSYGKCPMDASKLGVCANVLGLIKGKIVAPPKLPCCSLLKGLVDLDAAVCLCTAIKGNVLGIKLNLPIDLSLILNYCGKKVPAGFKCSY